jgi:DNA processing protein
MLYAQGSLPQSESVCVAIVGSRRPTDYGKQVTYRLASELAAGGIGIVSGLAIGIDAVAHEATLAAGGYTLAVLGSGLNNWYPQRNQQLASRILKGGGAIVSEYEPDMPALPHHFPARNRIIAGLSQAVIVTEAATGSGSLITASLALEENRQVMAVPGNITSQFAIGPNTLIKKGAVPITCAQDVLDALNLKSALPTQPPPSPQNHDEATIVDLIEQGVGTSQDLIERSGMAAAEFARVISLMEITGKVRNLGAGTWVRN